MRRVGYSKLLRSIRCASGWRVSASACWCCARGMSCGTPPREYARYCRPHVSLSCSRADSRCWRSRLNLLLKRYASSCGPDWRFSGDFSHYSPGRVRRANRAALHFLADAHGKPGKKKMRSRSRPPAPARGDPDPDSTAELPVLDPAGASTAGASTSTTVSTEALAGEAADQQQATTDNWALSPTARAALSAAAASAEKRLDQEAELRARTAALQEAQERLASHSKRLLQLEQARDEALAAQAAAAQRAATAEQRATNAEQRAHHAEQRATHAEQRV